MGANHWQPWENLFLHEVADQMPVPLIAEKLERTERAVYTQAARLDVKFPANTNCRKWTKAELFLFGRFTPEEISAATGRSIHSVRSKRNSLARSAGEKSCLNGLPKSWRCCGDTQTLKSRRLPAAALMRSDLSGCKPILSVMAGMLTIRSGRKNDLSTPRRAL